jgi:hypothetical protein
MRFDPQQGVWVRDSDGTALTADEVQAKGFDPGLRDVPLTTRTLVTFGKAPVDGKRPGDTFTRGGTAYRVVRVAGDRYWTESSFGREVWFTAPVLTSGRCRCGSDPTVTAFVNWDSGCPVHRYPGATVSKGKFDSDRDAVLHLMSLQLWANESDGDVESAQGYFSRISNRPEDIAEIRAAFEDDVPEGFAWSRLVGKFLMVEDSQGFVTVQEFVTDSALERNYEYLRNAYYNSIDPAF